ncbi:hypothetical protein V8G54_021976 [Vigna mungo]|uniref:Uncharacterized protein n=1 Tax=Vigna mungo TaxID=3915 RepID=A0AAQ3NF85_VIGMU
MSSDDSQQTCFLNQKFRAIYTQLLVLLPPKTESSKQHLEAAIDYVHESEGKSIINCQMNQPHMSLMSPVPTLIFLILKLIFFFIVHFCITFMIFSTLSKEQLGYRIILFYNLFTFLVF